MKIDDAVEKLYNLFPRTDVCGSGCCDTPFMSRADIKEMLETVKDYLKDSGLSGECAE